jgi:hypothetical protein
MKPENVARMGEYAARMMKENGMVDEFERRAQICTEGNNCIEQLEAFMKANSQVETLIGESAIRKIKAARERAEAERKKPPVSIWGFAAVEDGGLDVILPVKVAEKYLPLQSGLIDASRKALSSAGRPRISKQGGLVDLHVSAKNGSPEAAVRELRRSYEKLGDGKVSYNLIVAYAGNGHNHMRKDTGKKEAVKDRGAKINKHGGEEKIVLEYLSDHDKIGAKEFSDIAEITMSAAYSALSRMYLRKILKRVGKGVYGLPRETVEKNEDNAAVKDAGTVTRQKRGYVTGVAMSYIDAHPSITRKELMEAAGCGADKADAALSYLAYKVRQLKSTGNGVFVRNASRPAVEDFTVVPLSSSEQLVEPPVTAPSEDPVDETPVVLPREAGGYKPDKKDPVDRLYRVLKYLAGKGPNYTASRSEVIGLGATPDDLRDWRNGQDYIHYQGTSDIRMTKEGRRWLEQHNPGGFDA